MSDPNPIREVLHKLGPQERLRRLTEQLEAGDIPSNGELVATLRSIHKQYEHVEMMLYRHMGSAYMSPVSGELTFGPPKRNTEE